MILVGIDIGKDSHFFSIVRKEDGEVLAQPKKFTNTSEGFKILTDSFIPYDKESILIGMEETAITTSLYSDISWTESSVWL